MMELGGGLGGGEVPGGMKLPQKTKQKMTAITQSRY